MRKFVILSCFAAIFVIGGCAKNIELASHVGKHVTGSTDYAKSKGHYKVGNPYKIKGRKYYPKVDYGYDKKGVASWYGPNFHGKLTANGEIFNQNELTAAHKTLPLPSIVRVTNLENGKSLIVRVNDRGPYAHKRIIDLSKRSAEVLGFKNQGVADVRVEVLEAESKMVAQIAQAGQSTNGMEVAMNDPSYKVGKPIVPVSPSYKDRPIVSGTETIYVQTGAFSSEAAAMAHADQLRDYAQWNVAAIERNGNTMYRVRTASTDIGGAHDLVQQLIDDTGHAAIVVVD